LFPLKFTHIHVLRDRKHRFGKEEKSMNTMNIKIRCRRSRKEFWMICEETSQGRWIAKQGLAIQQKIPEYRIWETGRSVKPFFKEQPSPGQAQNPSRQSQQQGQLSRTEIKAPEIDPSYSCPYCQDRSYAQCGTCKNYFCWKDEEKTFICPWCGKHETMGEGTLQSVIGHQENSPHQISGPDQPNLQLREPHSQQHRPQALPPGTTNKRLLGSPRKHE